MKRVLFQLAGLLLCSSCASTLALRRDHSRETELTLEEMRMELADVKHALNSSQVEVSILEDRLKNHDNAIYVLKNQTTQPIVSQLSIQIAVLEKKFATFEKSQEKVLNDIRQLNTHVGQTSGVLTQYREKIQELEKEISAHTQRLEEVSKLKGTLASISKMMKQGQMSEPISQSYRVQLGDTLAGIASQYGTTIKLIKEVNRLKDDRIKAGDELKIPYDNH
jgi:LysM repeat protein